MTIVERAAYLKGLTEGMGIDPESKEGKLWYALNDLLHDMAHEIEDLQACSMDQADMIDEIADELEYLEEITCDLDLPEEYDSCDCDCKCRCDDDDDDDDDDDEEDDDDDDEDEDEEIEYDGIIYDATCPVCGEEISFGQETLEEGSVNCPGCGELLEFDLSEEEDEEAEED